MEDETEAGFTRRFIAGSGPTPCRILLVGEAGGGEEHVAGRPFVGMAGQVLNTYLAAVGLKRSQIHVDNVVPYWTGPGNPDPTPEQIAEGTPLLERTLLRVKPEIVGCLGRFATQWFLGEKASMLRDHGMIYRVTRGGRRYLVIPCFHPAAGFYDPSAAARCQEDLKIIASLVSDNPPDYWREQPLPPAWECQHPSARSATPVPRDGDALDTEGSVWKPQMLSWSEGGSRSYASYWQPSYGAPMLPKKLTFHYALHDLKVLRAMGVNTDAIDYDDTLTMAFNLLGGGQDSEGSEGMGAAGLGLKILAHRELQVKMRDFKELVRPWYNAAVDAWMTRLLEMKLPPKSETELKEGTGKDKGKWITYTPQPPARRFGAVLLAAMTGGEPEKKWKDLPESMKLLGEEKIGERFPTISTAIALVPKAEAVAYAGADAWATSKLAAIYKPRLQERGLAEVYEIDKRALPFYDDFIRNGMPYSRDRVLALKTEMEEAAKAIKLRLKLKTGIKGFNPGSREDVVEFLYRKHRLPAPRQTKGDQESTDAKSISILRAQISQGEFKKSEDEASAIVSFLDDILAFRERQKYLGTYISYIEEETRGLTTPRLHPSDITTTKVVSGRLAGPLLTMPQRTELGRRLRDLFVVGDGRRVLSLDYSQIELRMAAELSGDKVMLKAFRDGTDLHSLTGTALFKTKDEKVLKRKRPVSKQVNFSVLYGISARALWERFALAGIFDYTERQCQEFIDSWFELYSGITEYQEELVAACAKTGEVRDWTGRVRYVPNIRMTRGRLREKAERDVCNFPVQAGARALVKIAEGELVPWLRRVRGLVDPILDIHDELLFETDADIVEEAAAEIKRVMQRRGSERFSVPIEVGQSWGDSWGSAK